MANKEKGRLTVEVRSYSDNVHYHIVVGGHYQVLMSLPLPFHGKFSEILQEAHNNYMPVMTYDDNGSEIRQFDHNYVRVTHKMSFCKAEEIRPIMREQISDILSNEGWDMIGFAAHQGPVEYRTTVIEKWMKIC